MKCLRHISVCILLTLMAGMVMHNVIPHVHYSHSHVEHGHHHAAIPHHSHDVPEEEHSAWTLLSLLFAHHSLTAEIPGDEFVLAHQALLDMGWQSVALVDNSHDLAMRDGPPTGFVFKRSTYYSGEHVSPCSLRAPPALA